MHHTQWHISIEQLNQSHAFGLLFVAFLTVATSLTCIFITKTSLIIYNTYTEISEAWQKYGIRSLGCRDRSPLQPCYPIFFTVIIPVITWHPLRREGTPILKLWTHKGTLFAEWHEARTKLTESRNLNAQICSFNSTALFKTNYIFYPVYLSTQRKTFKHITPTLANNLT